MDAMIGSFDYSSKSFGVAIRVVRGHSVAVFDLAIAQKVSDCGCRELLEISKQLLVTLTIAADVCVGCTGPRPVSECDECALREGIIRSESGETSASWTLRFCHLMPKSHAVSSSSRTAHGSKCLLLLLRPKAIDGSMLTTVAFSKHFVGWRS